MSFLKVWLLLGKNNFIAYLIVIMKVSTKEEIGELPADGVRETAMPSSLLLEQYKKSLDT